jgi:hypothetical protein
MRRKKILGAYLLVGGILQACLYLALSFSPKLDWLFYFDPRIGIFFFESSWKGAEQTVTPSFLRWFTVGWILLLAVLFLSGRALIKTYIISEIVLLLPSILFFIGIVWANLSPAHGFSVGELLFPVLVTMIFSFVPLGLAFWSRRKPSNDASAGQNAYNNSLDASGGSASLN